MTTSSPTLTQAVPELADTVDRFRVTHIPDGMSRERGLTYHVLEVFNVDRWVPMARVDAVLVSLRSTPHLHWFIYAPGTFDAVPDLWLSCRAFATEGDAIDSLWRLHGLAMAGNYPHDIRDAI